MPGTRCLAPCPWHIVRIHHDVPDSYFSLSAISSFSAASARAASDLALARSSIRPFPGSGKAFPQAFSPSPSSGLLPSLPSGLPPGLSSGLPPDLLSAFLQTFFPHLFVSFQQCHIFLPPFDMRPGFLYFVIKP